MFSVSPTQEIRRPKQFDDDAEGGNDEDGSDEAADQVYKHSSKDFAPKKYAILVLKPFCKLEILYQQNKMSSSFKKYYVLNEKNKS